MDLSRNLSGAEIVSDWLRKDKRPYIRWGFVVYRTTYEDDAKWEACKEILDKLCSLDEENKNVVYAKDVNRMKKWVWVDNKTLFDREHPGVLRK